MNIVTGFNEFKAAFGKECLVNTKYGTYLSIKKILRGDPLNALLKMGFEIDKTYQSTGRNKDYRDFTPIKLIGYTPGMIPMYDITEVFLKHKHFFVKPTKKVIVHGKPIKL